jgi:hypothetical protein
LGRSDKVIRDGDTSPAGGSQDEFVDAPAYSADRRGNRSPRQDGRALLSSGYAVEPATDEKRVLKLARDSGFRMAIVAPGPYPANLATMLQLRNTLPQMIVLAERPEEIARLQAIS